MTKEKALSLAKEQGFSHTGTFSVERMQFRTEVRDMCKANTCGNYGRCWTCPPALPELEEIRERAKQYDWGLLIQTTAQMEDAFDAEAMVEAMEGQKVRFRNLCDILREQKEDCLPMSSGGCGLCETCTCPDAPCRFPEKAVPSMEAYGLLVTDVCNLTENCKYYYGENTITFTSCILFPEQEDSR